MIEVKIVMDDYGLLYVVLPDGTKRAIQADVFMNSYYGIIRVGEELIKEV